MGFSYTKVQLDVTTQNFYETSTICNTLEDSVSSGLMGTFFVILDEFSCRPVEGSLIAISFHFPSSYKNWLIPPRLVCVCVCMCVCVCVFSPISWIKNVMRFLVGCPMKPGWKVPIRTWAALFIRPIGSIGVDRWTATKWSRWVESTYKNIGTHWLMTETDGGGGVEGWRRWMDERVD